MALECFTVSILVTSRALRCPLLRRESQEIISLRSMSFRKAWPGLAIEDRSLYQLWFQWEDSLPQEIFRQAGSRPTIASLVTPITCSLISPPLPGCVLLLLSV